MGEADPDVEPADVEPVVAEPVVPEPVGVEPEPEEVEPAVVEAEEGPVCAPDGGCVVAALAFSFLPGARTDTSTANPTLSAAAPPPITRRVERRRRNARSRSAAASRRVLVAVRRGILRSGIDRIVDRGCQNEIRT